VAAGRWNQSAPAGEQLVAAEHDLAGAVEEGALHAVADVAVVEKLSAPPNAPDQVPRNGLRVLLLLPLQVPLRSAPQDQVPELLALLKLPRQGQVEPPSPVAVRSA
jgi:hypothetical protein